MMVTPSSSLVGKTVEDANFEGRHNCQVLGIQHHAHFIRSQMAKAKLAAGDLLLVKCDSETIPKLRKNLDVVLVEFSITELPNTTAANTSIFIFLAVVLSAALDIMPIVISAMVGALAMVLTNVISLQQALQAIDFKIATTIAAALALGVAMEATGAAAYLANLMLSIFGSASPFLPSSVLEFVCQSVSMIVGRYAMNDHKRQVLQGGPVCGSNM